MKIKNFTFIIFAAAISTIIIYGCKKKKEEEKTYTNADYAGTWSTTSQCSSSMSYQMTVTTSGSSGVVLKNFHANASTNGYTLNATVSDKTITIPTQTVTNSQGGNQLTFAGSGTLTPPSSLSISYTAKDPMSSSTISCTATCTK